MVENKNTALFAYLQYVLDQGYSASRLAKEAGISASTITRFMNSRNYKFTPSSVTIEKIAKATGINPAPFYRSRNFADMSLTPYKSKDLYDTAKWSSEANAPQDDAEGDIKAVIIIGFAEAGGWREPAIANYKEFGALPITYYDLKYSEMFAVIIKGKNIDKVARDREILVCVNESVAGWRISEGDVWVIERQLQTYRMVEISARVLKFVEGRPVLAHASSDERFQELLEVDDVSRTQDYRVIGLAVFIYRVLDPDPYALGKRPV